MTYKIINSFILALLMVSAAQSLCYAGPVPTTLKEITVKKMFQYATTLYDRNNEEEGVKVLTRILELDPNYGPALAKLHKSAVPRTMVAASSTYRSSTTTKTSYYELPAVGVVALSNEDLKREIQAEDKAIYGLHQEIARLKSETEDTSQ